MLPGIYETSLKPSPAPFSDDPHEAAIDYFSAGIVSTSTVVGPLTRGSTMAV